jgi:uncharacterized protein YfiM (DUF2279 family)
MARTARQRAALKKAQLASARKRRGSGKGKRRLRHAAITGVAIASIAGGAYATHKGVKKHRSKQLRRNIRYNFNTSKQRQHHAIHLHAKRQRAKGKGNRHLDPKVLDAQVIFTNKVSQKRVADRHKMTAKQKRASIPKAPRRRRTTRRKKR